MCASDYSFRKRKPRVYINLQINNTKVNDVKDIDATARQSPNDFVSIVGTLLLCLSIDSLLYLRVNLQLTLSSLYRSTPCIVM